MVTGLLPFFFLHFCDSFPILHWPFINPSFACGLISNLRDVVLYGCDESEMTKADRKAGADSDDDDSDDENTFSSEGVNPPSSSSSSSSSSAPAASPPPLSVPPVDTSEMDRFPAPLPLTGDWSWMNSRGRARIFPALLARRAPQYFSFDRSTFTVSKSKSGASRVCSLHSDHVSR
jgi:hypothetical protein